MNIYTHAHIGAWLRYRHAQTQAKNHTLKNEPTSIHTRARAHIHMCMQMYFMHKSVHKLNSIAFN